MAYSFLNTRAFVSEKLGAQTESVMYSCDLHQRNDQIKFVKSDTQKSYFEISLEDPPLNA